MGATQSQGVTSLASLFYDFELDDQEPMFLTRHEQGYEEELTRLKQDQAKQPNPEELVGPMIEHLTRKRNIIRACGMADWEIEEPWKNLRAFLAKHEQLVMSHLAKMEW